MRKNATVGLGKKIHILKEILLNFECVPGAFSLEESGRGVKLTTHLHLVPMSNNAWSYTSTPSIRLHDVVLS
jgi:hypothetical protein